MLTLRQLFRTEIAGDRRAACPCRGHGEEPDRQGQWRAGQDRLHDAAQRRELAHFDIYLDGAISEVATRRSEFAAILKNEGIDGLIAALNRKRTS